jgi:hypothetical protein
MLSLLLLALYVPSRVLAQSTTSAITLTPTFQEVVLEASESAKESTITIKNATTQPQTFEVFAVSINQIDSNGAITFSDKPLTGSDDPFSAEVSVAEPEVTLEPGTQQAVAFTVNNTINLSPGGHYVSLIVRAKPPTSDQTNQSVLPAISSFLLIRKVGGERYNLSLQKMAFSSASPVWWQRPRSVTLAFNNQGNVHTIPRGQVLITDLFGRVVIEGTINEGSQFVLPSIPREIAVKLRTLRWSLPIMIFKTTVKGYSDPGQMPFEQTAYNGYVSRSALIGLLMVATIVVLALRKWRRRKRTIKQVDS